MHSTLLSYTTSKHGNLVLTTSKPIMHHGYKITEPLVLNLHPFPIYNQMFHLYDIIVASYKCTYHAWCLGFHTQMFDKCEKSNCGATFDLQWHIDMGYKTVEENLKAFKPLSLSKGMYTNINPTNT